MKLSINLNRKESDHAKRSDVFPSKWLRNEDLGGKPLVVTIQSAEMQELKSPDGKTQSKMCVSFKEVPKSLALNLTNWDCS